LQAPQRRDRQRKDHDIGRHVEGCVGKEVRLLRHARPLDRPVPPALDRRAHKDGQGRKSDADGTHKGHARVQTDAAAPVLHEAEVEGEV